MPIATINPATGRTERTFEPHDSVEVERRLALAAAAVQKLNRVSMDQRAEWMKTAAGLLDEELEQVAAMLTLEMGKTIASARAEVAKCSKSMRFYAEKAESFLKPAELEEPHVVGASHAYARYEPLGVVLAVMPWNYPLWQVIRFAAPALMAGNAGLLKHASNVPQAALYLDSLFTRAGFPEGSFSTVLVGASAVPGLIADRRVSAVTLTGSEPAGRSVAELAGRHIKKTVLELGGSDPFIVLPSADVVAAAATAVTARTSNNGQSCIAGKRFIVHRAILEEFQSAFVRGMEALTVGEPSDETTDVGPLATKAGRDEIASLVDDAVSKGATLLAGGFAPTRDGWFYTPTVLSGITDDMRLRQEEAFGPVATIYEVGSIEEAVHVANETEFGLSSSVWTSDVDEQDYLEKQLQAGAMFVNGMTVSHPELPFGGTKNSGYGRELAAEGIREFCNLKTVWKL